jgi:hypothetical protein
MWHAVGQAVMLSWLDWLSEMLLSPRVKPEPLQVALIVWSMGIRKRRSTCLLSLSRHRRHQGLGSKSNIRQFKTPRAVMPQHQAGNIANSRTHLRVDSLDPSLPPPFHTAGNNCKCILISGSKEPTCQRRRVERIGRHALI